ncbi:hypothetical protein CEXT_802691 [Caerostris extrusa]|uniref:Uncharacterized protein n=1 Tax=Caerostris extrusa TaxID=172846 RepID=A0AAV4NSC6_CAEEX|nr:hypothetical protein CEXT_802691 [Caerostris extrusa]
MPRKRVWGSSEAVAMTTLLILKSETLVLRKRIKLLMHAGKTCLSKSASGDSGVRACILPEGSVIVCPGRFLDEFQQLELENPRQKI